MAFSATWNKKVVATNRALLGTAPDPAHAVVSAHDQEMNANAPFPDSWVSTTPNPGTVAQLEGESGNYVTAQGVQGGPVDHTPVDHAVGEGVGAGLTAAESQAQNAASHDTDYNATAARVWQRPGEVDYHNVAERLQEQAPIGQLGSPETVALHVGTNREAYPNQVVGHRIHRWRDRVMQRIQWQTDHRPMYIPNAYAASDRPAGDGPYMSPYPQLGHVHTVMEHAPQLRRVPESWGSAVTVDAMTVPAASAEPPLDVWGQ